MAIGDRVITTMGFPAVASVRNIPLSIALDYGTGPNLMQAICVRISSNLGSHIIAKQRV